MNYCYHFNKHFPKLNKDLDLQISNWKNISFGFDITYTQKQSHAGLTIDIHLFILDIYFNFTDTRHWDDNTNNWETYND